ncbi:50S ribosomal protein L4 [Thermatribacter velox]|uniref:Large ribosomal subunit protein uL4 n=1 Tax=Thermatribacter velox TaxID=3039681 RepID=A0ABZ2YG12_9BACT
MEIAVFDREGKTVDQLVIEEMVDEGMNTHLLFLAVKSYLDNQRRGTVKTKTRGEVSGGGRKPWRQKGTGRARHGSIRSPIWRGGGVVFGPRPRSYYFSLNKKEKRQAMLQSLLAKIKEGSLRVVENLLLEQPKTKEAVKLLTNLGLKGSTLVVTVSKNENVLRSFSNLENVDVLPVNSVSTYHLLKFENVVFEKPAFLSLWEVLNK